MSKTGLAALAVATIATLALTASADAQSRRYRDYGDAYRYGNAYGSVQQQYNYGPRVHGRRDPSSYDGYRTGNPRTCGSDFFRYDDRGVPSGPYCN